MKRRTLHGGTPSGSRGRAAEAGYSLVEVLVALLVALFLLGGLGTMVAGTHKTATSQTSLAALQDEERLATELLVNVVQMGGYFDTAPNAAGNSTYTAAAAFPAPITTTGTAPATTLAAGQIIGGVHGTISTPDTLAIRFATSGTDGVINCAGNVSAAAAIWTNLFYIDPAAKALLCSPDGGATSVTLVNNVVNMQVWYGVSTVAGTTNPDTYMNATQVTAAGAWNNVSSVKVTLTFDNPLAGQPGQPLYAFLTRVITLRARAA